MEMARKLRPSMTGIVGLSLCFAQGRQRLGWGGQTAPAPRVYDRKRLSIGAHRADEARLLEADCVQAYR